MGQGTRPPQGAESRQRQLTPEPPCGQRKEGQVAAVSAYVPGRWRQRPQAPGPPGASDAALRRAAPLPSAGAAQPVRLCAPRAPWARLGLGSCRVHRAARPAAERTMSLPRARAGAWAAAAKVAQRRRRVEGAGRSPSPVTRSQRAALYVHVSGEEAAGQESTRGLVTREPTRRLSPLPGEVLARTRALAGKCLCPGTRSLWCSAAR